MVRIKNIRPGIVLVSGLGIRLAPGGVASVERATAEIERGIAAGILVRLDDEMAAQPVDASRSPQVELPSSPETSAETAPEPPAPPEPSPGELAKLPQGELIQRIAQDPDANRLRALLALDKRPRVQDAIRKRLSEVEPVAPR